MLDRSLGTLVSVLLASCAVFVGCRGSGPESATDDPGVVHTRPIDTATVDTTQKDSSTADTTADTTASDGPIGPTPPPPAPAPGTAHVRGTIESCDATGQTPQCRIHVEAVLAYGSATPVLNTGERIVTVVPGLVEARTLDSLATLGERMFSLKHTGPRPAMDANGDEETPPRWSLHEISEP